MQGCRNPAIWGREGRLAKNLIATYTAEFLLWCPPPEGYKVGSLMWFFSDLGKNYLSDQLVEYKKQQAHLTEKKEIELAPAKIGEDVIVSSKPKSLKDFLKYGKTS